MTPRTLIKIQFIIDLLAIAITNELTPKAGDTPLPDIQIGKIFQEKFLILSLIGQGGMGQVFLAKNLEQDRLVAIKTLIDKYDQDKESTSRFYREFKLLSTLRHEGIVNVFVLGTDHHGNPYAVCEYVDGIDLRKLLLRDGPLGWQEVLTIIKQLAETLCFVHGNGIVHHDIKPDNIIIVKENGTRRAKLLDFGLSKLTERNEQEAKLTWTGQLLGSPQYMAPEQLRQRGDKRSDIYSVGCVAFELLSGEIPFNADTPIGVLWQKSNSAAETALGGLTVHTPKGLFNLLLKMLATEPSERYQSMVSVIEEIDNILKDPGPERSLAEWARESARDRENKSKLAPIALGLILLALIIITGPIAIWSLRSHNESSPAQKNESISSLESQAITLFKEGKKEAAFQKFAEAIALLRKDPKRMASSYQTFFTAVVYSSHYYQSNPRPELAAAILSYADNYCRLAAQRKDSSHYPECAAMEFAIAKDQKDREDIISKRIKHCSDTWGCKAPPTVESLTDGIYALLKVNDTSAATKIANKLEQCRDPIPTNSYPYLKYLGAKCLLNANLGKVRETAKDAQFVFDIIESGDHFLTLNQITRLISDGLHQPLAKIGQQKLFIDKTILLLNSRKSEFDSDPKLGQILCSAIANSYVDLDNREQASKYRNYAAAFEDRSKDMPRHKWLPR